MLNNKNNIISNLSMIFSPINNYGQTWKLSFNPIYSLIMMLGIGICLIAANWQFTKSQFYMAPVAQSVHIKGQYLNEYTHFLDNQTLNGQAGYAVITPFQYDSAIYLVNRGFVSYRNRADLPSVPAVMGTVELTGIMKENKKPLLLNESLQDPVFLRVQYINNEHFSMMLNQGVAKEIFLVQKGEGLMSPFPDSQPYLNHHRHMGYAIQWGLLAIAGLIIWFIASIKRGIKE